MLGDDVEVAGGRKGTRDETIVLEILTEKPKCTLKLPHNMPEACHDGHLDGRSSCEAGKFAADTSLYGGVVNTGQGVEVPPIDCKMLGLCATGEEMSVGGGTDYLSMLLTNLLDLPETTDCSLVAENGKVLKLFMTDISVICKI